MASNYVQYPQTGGEKTSTPIAPIEEMDTRAALKEQPQRQRGLYAYGVMGNIPLQRDILGIDKRNKVYPVNGKDIRVMVSEIDVGAFQKQVKNLFAELTAGQYRTETLLQVHEDVLDLLMQDTTVVPFKFGTILKDEKAALKLLQDDALVQLSAVTEMIFQELGKDVYEARLNKTLPQKLTGKKKEMVLNTVYLVEQEKVSDFCKQGKILMEKYAGMGLDLEVSGPWPPYNFTY